MAKKQKWCVCGNQVSKRASDGLCGACRPQPEMVTVSVEDWECDCEEDHYIYLGVPSGCPCDCHETDLTMVRADEIIGLRDLHGTAVIERLAAFRASQRARP